MAIDEMVTPAATMPTDGGLPPTGAAPAPQAFIPPPPKKRPPSRRKSFISRADAEQVVNDLLRAYDEDLHDRQDWADARLQRYAKLRGWLEAKEFPWPGASNAHIPVLMQDSLRTQDTLHNAVMSVRPAMSAKALHKQDEPKTETIDHLLDYQLFVEQNGEEKIGDLIDSFVNDGTFVAFIPYVKDDRMVPDVRTFDVMPPEVDPLAHILNLMQQIYPNSIVTSKPNDDYVWDLIALDEEGRDYTAHVRFFLDEFDRVQMISERHQRVFEGPCLIPKALEDVVVPSRSSNLQPPGPSNPGGADHVFLVDYPDLDEIKKLVDQGVYDLVRPADLEALAAYRGMESGKGLDPGSAKTQKDEFTGQTFGNAETSKSIYTRLIAFARYDADGDGLDEDVVFWLIKESRTLLRARYLTEMWPSNPPRRPFAEARYLQVPGQFYGVGLLELMENLYDILKTVFDQMIDNGTLTNTPWGLYRAASGVRPEVIRMSAGELYPVADPKNDVFFPQMPNANQAFGINMVTLLTQFGERLTSIGELQLGRVPYGKASALRTGATMQALLAQGDARPERILRRFFRGLSEVYQQMHELNQAFLPARKKYRITGDVSTGTDPYREVEDLSSIRGRFQFDFKANILNTSKAAYSQIMQQMLAVLVNPLTLQTGIVDVAKLYTVFREWIKSVGQEPSKFINKPSPVAGEPTLMWQEAVATILDGQMPSGQPEEGAVAHLQGLAEYQKTPEYQTFVEPWPGIKQLFLVYLQKLVQMAQMELQNQAMMQAAQGFQQSMSGGGGNGSEGTPQSPGGTPQVQPNEFMDEIMPTAGGGASAKS